MSISTAGASTDLERRQHEFVREWFAISDSRQLDRYREYLAEDVELTFGNAEPIRGVGTVIELGKQMNDSLKSAIHELRVIRHGTDGSVTVEMWVDYTRLDGRKLRIPASVVFEFDGEGKIATYRVYVDQGDLNA